MPTSFFKICFLVLTGIALFLGISTLNPIFFVLATTSIINLKIMYLEDQIEKHKNSKKDS